MTTKPSKQEKRLGWRASAIEIPEGKAARRGVYVGTVAQLVQQAVTLLATLALARLLTADEFGLAAAVQTVLGLGQTLLTFGIGAAVARRDSLDRGYLSTLFWLAALGGVAVAAALAAASPWLAAGFGSEGPLIFMLVGPVLVFQLTSSVPLALLQRELRFGRFYSVQVLAAVNYAWVQVALAAAGLGEYAVVLGLLVLSASLLLGGLVAARWTPALKWRFDLVRADLPYGRDMLGNQVLAYGGKTLDNWIVGLTLGPAALGVYYVAFVLPNIVRIRMTTVVNASLFILMSRRRSERELLLTLYRKALLAQLLVGLPVLTGIAVCAEPIILTAFGDGWGSAVTPMRLLAFAAAIDLYASPAGTLALAGGWVRRNSVAQIVKITFLFAGAAVVVLDSPNLVALSCVVVISVAAGGVVQQTLLRRDVGALLDRRTRWLATFLVTLSAAMAAGVWGLTELLPEMHAVLELAVLVPAGVLLYVVPLVVPRGPGPQLLALALPGLDKKGPSSPGSSSAQTDAVPR